MGATSEVQRLSYDHENQSTRLKWEKRNKKGSVVDVYAPKYVEERAPKENQTGSRAILAYRGYANINSSKEAVCELTKEYAQLCKAN